jgi:hypothetical protein
MATVGTAQSAERPSWDGGEDLQRKAPFFFKSHPDWSNALNPGVWGRAPYIIIPMKKYFLLIMLLCSLNHSYSKNLKFRMIFKRQNVVRI